MAKSTKRDRDLAALQRDWLHLQCRLMWVEGCIAQMRQGKTRKQAEAEMRKHYAPRNPPSRQP